jgi:SAM-dependent methyltransferase
VRGVPVLIDEGSSVLVLADYERSGDSVLAAVAGQGRLSALRRLSRALYRLIPDVDANVGSAESYRRLAELLRERSARPRVLVVGGAETGKGMTALHGTPGLELVETDIDFGPRTQVICDAHVLPFEDGSFDGVVVQAVLEHVLDPHRCVEEIWRVLSPGGLVYAETPFLQRRHAGPFDFTRFTFLGHRRLFRRFAEEGSGVAVGPGVALALAYTGFLLSLSRRRAIRAFLRIFGRLTSFWWKWFDPFISRNDAALDSAAGLWFLGRKSGETLSDRDLIRGFRGLR